MDISDLVTLSNSKGSLYISVMNSVRNLPVKNSIELIVISTSNSRIEGIEEASLGKLTADTENTY